MAHALKNLLTVPTTPLTLSTNPPKLLLIKLPAFNFRRQPTQEDYHGADSNHHIDSATARRSTSLAVQPKLGLWTKRRTGIDPDHCAHPGSASLHLGRGSAND